MQQFSLRKPDDWHCHLREQDWLDITLPASQQYARVVAMPNLQIPVTTIDLAIEYYQRIAQHCSALSAKPDEILLTVFCSDWLRNEANVQKIASDPRILAVKLYPASVTTNSAAGIGDLSTMPAILELLQKYDVPLMVHAEDPSSGVDPFDKEKLFIDKWLRPWRWNFPNLRICVEHITTTQAVEFVKEAPANLCAASITPHHLLHNRGVIFQGGINPHFYCLPLLKANHHQQALIQVALSDDEHFFAGTDSAPHLKHDKQSDCGCAGIFNAENSFQRYAELFIVNNKLENLEKFTSSNGAKFYGLPLNNQQVTLQWDKDSINQSYADIAQMNQSYITPIGEIVQWGSNSCVNIVNNHK